MMRARTDEERHGVGLFMRLLRLLPQATHYVRNFQIFFKYYDIFNWMHKTFHISLRLNKPEKLTFERFETCILIYDSYFNITLRLMPIPCFL